MVVVGADRLRLADVGHVDDAHAAVPAAGVQPVADAQRVMQAMLAARPRRLLAAREVLPGYPPARHFLGLRRIADVVDDENVADVAFGISVEM